VIQNLDISALRADAQAQPRAAILTEERMAAWDEFPPLVLQHWGSSAISEHQNTPRPQPKSEHSLTT
jgi:hypothetical protein